jgi:pimeloyl-ACP methyl ester carboxylesterase/transcriptional regulator with XRE-family HTH domain
MARSTAAQDPAAFPTFGALLRYLRRRRRLTQIDLAIAVGYSTGQISRLEQNQRLPNPTTLQALFVPALGLEDEPKLAARLLELAQSAHDQRAADAWLPEAATGVTTQLPEPEPRAADPERTALDATPVPPTSPSYPLQPVPFVSRHEEQQIRFCTAPDGIQIAYATVGAGPVLVKAANWLSHLEFDWNSPVWRHWLTGLSAHHTLVRYDERGCGLSDWEVDDFSLEAWVRDLETVVDTLGLERFPLLGISQGGPVAIAYAVRHPEKVSHLILYGTYACGLLKKRNPTAAQLEELETLLQLIKVGWGQDNPAFRQVFTTFFMPEATAEQMHWFNDLQRMSTSPANAAKFRTAFSQLDVRDLATRVTTPTLVLHTRDDAAEPFEEGRRLAALIPGARFIPLEGKNHLLLESEPAWQRFLAEVDRFLGGPATVETAGVEGLMAPAKPIADARPNAAAQGVGAANSAQIDQSPAGDGLPLNLLATKLFVPRPRPNAVRRARLLVRLDAALHTPLTLVAAPAGFGKTTVLADWLSTWDEGGRRQEEAGGQSTRPSSFIPHPFKVAWFALDDGDNDPNTFLRYLIAAFQMIEPTIGGRRWRCSRRPSRLA